MARTRGAVDKRPRKRSTVSRPRAKPAAQAAKGLADTSGLGSHRADSIPSSPSPEFFKSIEAAMSASPEPQDGPGEQAPRAGTSPACPPAPASGADELPLTKEAWEGVLRVPFRLLAQLANAPAVSEIGNRRAKDLAKPSYLIFSHYAEQYMALNPENPLSLAWAATGLVLADIGADVAMEIARARAARRAAAQAATVPGGQLVAGQAA